MLYLELFLSFVKVGFGSFGGLSMIPLINQEMTSHGWLTAGEVSDIVAIAEMTPGSLGVNCATFAGIQAGGFGASLVAVLGVMTPSLTLCLLAAVFLAKLSRSPWLARIMGGIRPVCFGMILASAVTLSASNYLVDSAVSLWAILIGALVLVLLVRFRWSVPAVIGVSAALGVLLIR
ncbi:MAG: chromate transporter [Oscillospiraceae bacterium]|nr:chromate transporter [Oscillospiraceae bacterium]